MKKTSLFQFIHRSTPVETLHTILLGPYKYLVQSLMGHLNSVQKEELEARITSFEFSGFENKIFVTTSVLMLAETTKP